MSYVRFHYSGTNHEGRKWVAGGGTSSFGIQVESDDSKRRKVDGTVASAPHDAKNPSSDHRPRPFVGKGTVRAIDVGVDSMSQGMAIIEPLRLSRDSRLKYLIFNNAMFSSYWSRGIPPFTWRNYSGSNGHIRHFHKSDWVSADTDNRPWTIGTPGGGDMAAMQIIDVQKALNEAGRKDFEGNALKEDDEYGPRTASALVKAYSNDGHIGGPWAEEDHDHGITGKTT